MSFFHRATALCLSLLGLASPLMVMAAEPATVADGFHIDATDWPWWRGPARNGQADPHQSPPTTWSEDQNILWKVPIEGRGHGSCAIVGDRIFLQTADESLDRQSVICLQRSSGKELWKQVVHPSGGMRKNKKSTEASSTPACDGERIYVNFPNSDALVTSALSLDGKLMWQTQVSPYVMHQGYGSSPALYQSLVIVTADNKGGGAIAALDRKTGSIVWKRDRPAKPNYSSPIVVHSHGRDQLIMTGCDLVTGFHPLTGETLWEIEGATTECVTSTVTDGERIFTSGGYPKNHVSAVRTDGSGKIEWANDERLYVPSLIHRDGFLYAVLDAGIAVCWESATGKERWKSRLGGTFSTSPVLVDDTLYATSEGGETFLFRADPDRYQEVARNQLGDEILATPVIVGSRIYYRAAKYVDGNREEFLYCIGR